MTGPPIPEGMEPSRLRTIRGFAIGILAGLVLASAGVASAKQGRSLGPSPEVVSLVTDEPDLTDVCVEEAEASDVPDQTSEGDESNESDEGESEESDEGESEESDEGEESDEECPPVEEEQESDEDDPEPTTEPGDRQAECEEAAGLSESDEGEEEEAVRGLDHAIEVVLANCVKNPQAPGLVNALRHLAENRERKMAHDEAKAERKAAHAAGKGPKH
jgi:hypothetical protein